MNTRHSILTLLSLCAVFAVSTAFAAGNADKEISTAIIHAGFASKMKDTKHVHLHLHHVVNCLVGPHGAGFYAPAGDPCKGMGNGAMNDAKGSFAVKNSLKMALDDAQSGLATNDFKAAHDAAVMAEKELKGAKNGT